MCAVRAASTERRCLLCAALQHACHCHTCVPQVLGGEACLWGEGKNASNIHLAAWQVAKNPQPWHSWNSNGGAASALSAWPSAKSRDLCSGVGPQSHCRGLGHRCVGTALAGEALAFGTCA